ncbi:hypothetical protein Ate02nite_95910 [Paractinoplanes tereljensis]|uniref:Uncharacterized protein n=1 Tax=Paractinoplanes tereljensis TaxID=571912 RepID=A0A919NZM2_9ACTN|nr:hypothetical protein Ate02nite_95910 [Actinoplanes tereljensis]
MVAADAGDNVRANAPATTMELAATRDNVRSLMGTPIDGGRFGSAPTLPNRDIVVKPRKL